jgi:hypothetical protein
MTFLRFVKAGCSFKVRLFWSNDVQGLNKAFSKQEHLTPPRDILDLLSCAMVPHTLATWQFTCAEENLINKNQG